MSSGLTDWLEAVAVSTLHLIGGLSTSRVRGIEGCIKLDGSTEVAVKGGEERLEIGEGSRHDGIVHCALSGDDGVGDVQREVIRLKA